ncbi:MULTISPECIES: hypothetical protein [Bacillus cereus group]|uniref:hypothetical protein n=1 Tax=Bacillus cereus group TaxID=86661 RepID=UPI000BFA4050|nr:MULTISPECIES: hypothetical protein [Bacillus cereus group]PES55968.1 hypothetical protein CN499_05965 [Bacillus thuringiensis]PGV22944.1 hypothetical protein COD93_29195 [Bacillus cereus]HDX9674046.1 hypothetical protein [Bacillus cereus]
MELVSCYINKSINNTYAEIENSFIEAFFPKGLRPYQKAVLNAHDKKYANNINQSLKRKNSRQVKGWFI